jgi:hypothetical protein
VAGKEVLPHMYDGNHVVASIAKRPWQKQLNLLLAYLFFYNPFWLVSTLLRKKNRVWRKAAGMQVVGMAGVLFTIRGTAGWLIRLMTGRISRHTRAPQTDIRVRGVDGLNGSHLNCESTHKPEPLVTLRIPARAVVSNA